MDDFSFHLADCYVCLICQCMFFLFVCCILCLCIAACMSYALLKLEEIKESISQFAHIMIRNYMIVVLVYMRVKANWNKNLLR